MQYIVLWRYESGDQGFLICGNKLAAEAKLAELDKNDSVTSHSVYRISSKQLSVVARQRTITDYIIED